MQNIKEIFFYSVLISSMQIGHHAYAKAALEVSSTILVEGLKDTTQMTCKAATQLAENHLPVVGEIAKETSAKLGAEAVGKTIPALNTCAAIYAVTQLWTIGKDVKSYFWPSQEEIAHAMEVNKKYEQLVTKKSIQGMPRKKRTQ